MPVGCPKSLYLTLFMHESDPAHYLKSFDEFLATFWFHKQNTNAYNRFTALTSPLVSVLIQNLLQATLMMKIQSKLMN